MFSHIISRGIIESLQSYLDEVRMRDWGFSMEKLKTGLYTDDFFDSSS
ncbi:hypothetical protein IQA49_14225 [Leptospira borgpetersenii serovar Ballum]|uniref:Uncharacterized protein n=1 Tax=Leptospira borgpetersenii serovar Ballum TaxID=280505 RepID=A0A0S2IXM0_LEPBO|nr:hypothetical protein [Leptospira borgpetersenii]ANH02373.1 Uncharacterized protein LB4E_3255 [Leptospira borgpetersenii str. 4E]EKR01083.1 hypothetical protein LEP1GSC121_1512 [Leptospira borgpetersenii serovar Castellonis str. 200801910]EMO09972.1 hypothetical protein LEP1GSC137_0211 [Leptospira borgpetersenii str. Noumea 25]ALO28277.1 hypothetical protein LBBP_04148 [Leptospira borgpetersenii serovar Ballum]MBE8161860.1 hypothetical protein [Leptospira borgpetersenii serovar Ballum]